MTRTYSPSTRYQAIGCFGNHSTCSCHEGKERYIFKSLLLFGLRRHFCGLPEDERDQDGRSRSGNNNAITEEVRFRADRTGGLGVEPEELRRQGDLLLSLSHEPEPRRTHAKVSGDTRRRLEDVADILSGFQNVPPKIVGRLREVPLLEWDPGVVNVEVGRCRIAHVVDFIDYVNWLANFPVFLAQLLVKEDKWGRIHGTEEQ